MAMRPEDGEKRRDSVRRSGLRGDSRREVVRRDDLGSKGVSTDAAVADDGKKRRGGVRHSGLSWESRMEEVKCDDSACNEVSPDAAVVSDGTRTGHTATSDSFVGGRKSRKGKHLSGSGRLGSRAT